MLSNVLVVVFSAIRALVLHMIVVLCLGVQGAAAQDLYADCIKGYDFGMMVYESFTLAPFSLECQASCKNACNTFSRKDSSGSELNYDSITNCISQCQAGNTYSGYYYESDPSSSGPIPKMTVKGPLQVATTCSAGQIASNTTYKSSYKFSAGDQIQVTLTANPDGNKVYLCGKHATTLDPLIKSPDPADWTKNTVPTTALKRTDTKCSMEFPDSMWNSATNFALWDESNANFWSGSYFATMVFSPFSHPCTWNARNPYRTFFGVYPVDGDELDLTWYGFHMAKIPTPGILTYKDLWFAQKNSNTTIAKAASDQVNIQGPSITVYSPNGTQILNGESFRTSPVGQISASSVSNPPPPTKIWGLTGSVFDSGVQLSAPGSSTVTDPGIPVYNLSGVLKGFSDNQTVLFMQHSYGASNAVAWFSDNTGTGVGGLTVNIKHGGCPYTNGQMLQYAFAQTEPPDGDTAWKDVDPSVFQGSALNAANSGYLFVKFKNPIYTGPSLWPAWFPSLGVDYQKKSSRYGSYNLTVALNSNLGSFVSNGPIQQLVNTIRFTLYGDPSKPDVPGVIEKLYNNLIKQSMVIMAVQTILVLYICFTALGFLIGTVQMHQQEVVKRVVKFACVVAIISPTSWDFFSNNFYRLFIDGGLELIGKIVQGSLQSNSIFTNIQNDPSMVFVIFDGPFRIFFAKPTWIKIGAMIFQGLYGFLIAFFLIYAAVYYALSIGKATLMFVSSMITIGVLIFVAPLFFCFMLFNFTRNFFTNWWKFLLSFTLQPVAVFTSIAIFNILIIIALKNALGFTVCPACFATIQIPLVMKDPYCLIPIYKVLVTKHTPNTTSMFYLPYMVLQSSILLMILCKGMFDFCDFIAKVIALIISGSPMFEATVAAPAQRATEAIKSTVGLDSASQRLRMQRGGMIHPPKG